MTLPLRDFGTTGLKISAVGFGAWAADGGNWAYSWGQQDDRQSIAAIRRAVDHGVNWMDAAPVYGYGHSEEIVARALSEMPEAARPFVFTKCGLEWNRDQPLARSSRIGDTVVLRSSVDVSLKRLGVDVLDLLLMHWPASDNTPLETYWQTLLDLKATGKVRAVGLSNPSSVQLSRAESLGHVDALQNPFSALRRDFAKADLPWCVAHRTGTIVYSPMQSGLLSGAFSRERAERLDKDDWRSRARLFKGEELTQSLAVVKILGDIGGERGVSAGAVAIAWTLSWRGVTGAIVGARNAARVDGWIAGATLELSAIELEQIANVILESGAGSGPTLPPTDHSARHGWCAKGHVHRAFWFVGTRRPLADCRHWNTVLCLRGAGRCYFQGTRLFAIVAVWRTDDFNLHWGSIQPTDWPAYRSTRGIPHSCRGFASGGGAARRHRAFHRNGQPDDGASPCSDRFEHDALRGRLSCTRSDR